MSPNRRFEVPTMDIHPSHYEEIAINEQDVNNIILSYLAHNFYEESSEAFIACIGMQRPAEYLESMQTKKRIVNYVLEGNSLKAIELIEQLSQDILKNNKDLMLDLLSLHFVVLVCSQKCRAEAVEFAQANMSSYASHSIYSERVEDFMSLLAFKNILESPMAHLTTTGYRQHVVGNLNVALLEQFNLPNCSTMERLMQQLTLVREDLRRMKGLPPFSLRNFLMHSS